MSKYRAVKTVVDGIKFDSKLEAKRYGELKLLERAGKISRLKIKPSWELTVDTMKICKYVADFGYHDGKKWVVEDTKGVLTPIYRLKKKLMKALYNIDIVEIRK